MIRLAASILSSIAILILFSAPAVAAPEGWLTSLGEAMNEAKAKDARILVDLYAEWCGWCKVLEKEVFADPRFREYVADNNFVLLHVDTEDGAEGTALQARYDANSLPTTLILDSDMVKIGAVSGYAPTAEFLSHIDTQIQAWSMITANYSRVLEGEDVDLQRRMAEDMHERGDGPRAAALYEKVLSRVQKNTEAAAWLHYLAADSHRLAKDYERASQQLASTRSTLEQVDGGSTETLAERADFLTFLIAQDGGDCKRAVTALHSFLEAHPRSPMRQQAKKSLDLLEGDAACT